MAMAADGRRSGGADTPSVDAAHGAPRIPETARRVLLVGNGGGDARLDVTGPGREVSLATLEEFLSPTPARPPYDLVVVANIRRDVDILALFRQARQCLERQGTLVLIGELTTRAGSPACQHLDEVCALARRFGLKVTGQGALDGDSIAGAGQLQTRQDDERNPLFLELQKGAGPRWLLSAATPGDAPAIRRLFREVFQHELSEALWQWKYGDGRGEAILAWRDDQLVAHYGGMRRDVLVQGEAAEAIQICDVMVKGSERGVLTRSGPFFLTCATFLERFIGYGRRHLLGFGFPSPRAMAVAERQGLYWQVDSMVEQRWPALSTRASVFSHARRIDERASNRVRRRIDQLWQTMAGAFARSIIGVRDWAYLRRRYLTHPERSYQLFLVRKRLPGTPLGVIVLAAEGERCRLMDLVGDPVNFAVLIFHARRIAKQLGAHTLYGWITRSHAAYWASDQQQPLEICIPSSAWTEGPAKDEVENLWWLTAGDMDFC